MVKSVLGVSIHGYQLHSFVNVPVDLSDHHTRFWSLSGQQLSGHESLQLASCC